jgi:hypothetical protein
MEHKVFDCRAKHKSRCPIESGVRINKNLDTVASADVGAACLMLLPENGHDATKHDTRIATDESKA